MLYGIGRELEIFEVNNTGLRDDCAKVLLLMLAEEGMPSMTF